MLQEEKAGQERVEGILSDERDARTALQRILILSTIEERESRVRFLDGFEDW